MLRMMLLLLLMVVLLLLVMVVIVIPRFLVGSRHVIGTRIAIHHNHFLAVSVPHFAVSFAPIRSSVMVSLPFSRFVVVIVVIDDNLVVHFSRMRTIFQRLLGKVSTLA